MPLGGALVGGCSAGDALRCGPGTIADGDTCVAAPSGDLTKPQVASVTLTQLAFAAEGVHPLHPGHPASVSLTLSVVGEAFETSAVIGVETADGRAACVLGSVDVSHQPKDRAAPAAFAYAGELYVQPSCAALVGQSELRAWISFDPFDHVDVAGRKPIEVVADADIIAFFRQSRLDLAACKAGPERPHPESCVTSLAMTASPGIDLRLDDVALDSTITTLTHAIGASTVDPIDLGADDLPPEYAGATFDTSQAKRRRLPTTPDFHVNTRSIVFGADASNQAQLGPDQIALSFALRPDPTALAATPLPDELLAWVPLDVERQNVKDTEGKGPSVVSIDRLEQQFVAGMAQAKKLQKESPVFFSEKARGLVSMLGDAVRRYELRVCMKPKFAEGSDAADPTANNCAVKPVIVLVERRDAEGEGLLDDPKAASSFEWNKRFEKSSGSRDTLKGTIGAFTNNGCTTGLCSSTIGAYADVEGLITTSVFDIGAHAQGSIQGTQPNEIDAHLRFFGLSLFDKTWSLANGITVKPPLYPMFSQVATFPLKACAPIGCVGIAISIGGTVGIEPAATLKERNFSEYCNTTNTSSSGRCFRLDTTARGWRSAKKACEDSGGYLAEIRSAAENATATGVLTRAGRARAWIGASQKRAPCADIVTNIATLRAARVPAAIIATLEGQLAACNAAATDPTFRWTSGAALDYVAWPDKLPDNYGGSESAVVLEQTNGGYWNDMNPTTLLPSLCAYEKTFDLSFTARPFLSIDLRGEASVDLKVAVLGAYVNLNLLTGEIPNTVGLRWSFERLSPLSLRTQLYYDATASLSGLSGDFGLFTKVLGVEVEYPLVSWDGITYASWDLYSVDKTWIIP
ncbi:MAG: C-type lectin domain-containing protein [Labilithrix sp.]|nr:C-type lectin domain-containing protein [Labilithrix sp.]